MTFGLGVLHLLQPLPGQVLTNHHSTSALFKSCSKLFLLKPGDTRFYSAYIAVRRLLRCQSAVRKTVVSEEWDEWAAKRDYREKAKVVSKAVLDPGFLRAIANFCHVLKPIVRLLRLLDNNMPSMGKVSGCRLILARQILSYGLLGALLHPV